MSDTDHTDMDEPPTKVSKVETSNETNMTDEEVDDEMEEGQEEWLSEGLLTDDDYNPTAELDQSDSNLTSIDETQVSMPNTSMEEETQQEKKIESIEKTLTTMNSQSQISDDLNAFLIRKTDGKVLEKKEDLTDDGNDTDDLLRLLGEDEEKTKKKVLVKTKDKGSKDKNASNQNTKKGVKTRHDSASTEDDDDFVFKGASMTKLKVAKIELTRNLPASKALPEDMSDEDDDETDASSDEAKTMKKIFNVRKPGKFASKGDSKLKETASKTKSRTIQTQPKISPKNTRSQVAKAKIEQTPSPSRKQQRNVPTPKSSPAPIMKSSVKASPKPVVKPSPKPVAKPSPKPVAKPSPKTVVKPSPKPVAKPSPKPVAKPSPKPVAKPSPKPIAKPSPKPVFKPSPKPVFKPSPKPTVKPSPKSNVQPSPMPIFKPAQQPLLSNKPGLRSVAKQTEKTTPRPAKEEWKLSSSDHEEIINEEEFQEEDDFDLDEDFVDSIESEFENSRDQQLIMRPEEMDEEVPSDADSYSDDEGDSFDELPSSDSEDLDDWFTLDLRAERAAEYIPMLGTKAYEMLLEEKRRVSDRLDTLRARVAELSNSGKRQEDLIRNASLTVIELDDMLKAT